MALDAIADSLTGEQKSLGTITIKGNVGSNNGEGADTEGFGWTSVALAQAAAAEATDRGVFIDQGGLWNWSLSPNPMYTFAETSQSVAITTREGGTVILYTDGHFDYTAPNGFYGVDTFEYALINADLKTFDTATVTLNVSYVESLNQRADTATDVYEFASGSYFYSTNSKQPSLLSNDKDDGGVANLTAKAETIRAFAENGASAGFVSIYQDGTFAFMPSNTAFKGLATFSYTAIDADGATTVETVKLYVGVPAPAPAEPPPSDPVEAPVVDVTAPVNEVAEPAPVPDQPPADPEPEPTPVAVIVKTAAPTEPTPVVTATNDTELVAPPAPTQEAVTNTNPDPVPVQPEEPAPEVASPVEPPLVIAEPPLEPAPVVVAEAPVTSTTPVAADDEQSGNQAAPNLVTIAGNVGVENKGLADSGGLGWTSIAMAEAAVSGATDRGLFLDNGGLWNWSLSPNPMYTFAETSKSVAITTKMGGVVILDTNGDFRYTAPAGYHGPDSFEYAYVDAALKKFDTALVTLTVNLVEDLNQRPDVTNDLYEITAGEKFDTAATSQPTLLANDKDDGGLPIAKAETVRAFAKDGTPAGLVSIFKDGNFAYEAPAGFTGEITFTYTAIDSDGATAVGTATLVVGNPKPVAEPPPVEPQPVVLPPTVVDPIPETPALPLPPPANIAPVANPIAVSGSHLHVISGRLFKEGAVDAEGQPLEAIPDVVINAKGTLEIHLDGSFTFAPVAGQIGDLTVAYQITDGTTSVASELKITTTNELDVHDDHYEIAYGQSVSGNVLQNDFDADGDVLAVAMLPTENKGFVSINEAGDFTYTPKPGFVGTDVFSYEVSDQFGTVRTAKIYITVNPVENVKIGTTGDDVLKGTASDETFFANEGIDTVNAGGGSDTVYGGSGKDTLYGEAGNDNLSGEAGADTLVGGDGSDILDGGANGDRMTGGAGADKFVLGRSSATDFDRITDFTSADQFVVNGADYGLSANEPLASKYFGKAGTADPDHGRFVYNSSNRALYWDTGVAGETDILLTKFSNKVTITASDFDIV